MNEDSDESSFNHLM